jgi:hypothetical protein
MVINGYSVLFFDREELESKAFEVLEAEGFPLEIP